MTSLKGKALVAYLLICTVWGSTFLAIRVGVATIPPLLFAGGRFLAAGLLLGGGILMMGQVPPRTRRDWLTLAVSGTLLLVSGNAVVVWAEQSVESGTASVFAASVPLWTAFFDTVIPGGSTKLTWHLLTGLALGFLGCAILAGVTPAQFAEADLRGPVALILASASWALGTVIMKRRPTDTTPYVTAAGQMAIGGAILVAAGVLTHQTGHLHANWQGTAALGYVIVFGSIIGYTAYAYAIRHLSPTIVGTYAFVNPIVAVLLGWLILDEAITLRMVAAMILVLGAVILIQFAPAWQTRAAVARRTRANA